MSDSSLGRKRNLAEYRDEYPFDAPDILRGACPLKKSKVQTVALSDAQVVEELGDVGIIQAPHPRRPLPGTRAARGVLTFQRGWTNRACSQSVSTDDYTVTIVDARDVDENRRRTEEALRQVQQQQQE